MTDPDRPSPLGLERARLSGEPLDDPAARAQVDALRADDAAFLARYPDSAALSRAARPRPRAFGWMGGLAGLAIAAVLLMPRGEGDAPTSAARSATSGVRAKGDSAVRLYVLRGEVAVPFEGRAAAGDILVIRHRTERRFMLVMGLGEQGASAWLAANGRSVRIRDGEDHTAETGVRLDDAPGPERIFVVLSDAPLEAAVVAERIERGLVEATEAERGRLDPGPLGLGADVQSWLLDKGGPR
jgi:hypothetical protein